MKTSSNIQTRFSFITEWRPGQPAAAVETKTTIVWRTRRLIGNVRIQTPTILTVQL